MGAAGDEPSSSEGTGVGSIGVGSAGCVSVDSGEGSGTAESVDKFTGGVDSDEDGRVSAVVAGWTSSVESDSRCEPILIRTEGLSVVGSFVDGFDLDSSICLTRPETANRVRKKEVKIVPANIVCW